MDMAVVCGMGIVSLVLAVTLRQYKPEYGLFLSLTAGVLIFAAVLRQVLPALDEVRGVLGQTGMPSDYIGILFRALGVCFLTQLACDACRDAGESSLASRIEIAGRISLLILAAPLFGELLSVSDSLIHW